LVASSDNENNVYDILVRKNQTIKTPQMILLVSHIRARRIDNPARRAVAVDELIHSDSKPAQVFITPNGVSF